MKLKVLFLFLLISITCFGFDLYDISVDQRTDGSNLIDIWFNIEDLETGECVDLFIYPVTMANETLNCRTFIEPASPRTICDNGFYHIVWDMGTDVPEREFRENEILIQLYAGFDGFYPGPCSIKPRLAGGIHWSTALKLDGTVWAWGREYSGCLGTGGGSHQSTPVRVSGIRGHEYLEDIQSLYSDGWHNAALHEDGTVWTWGYNVYGRLGDGTTTNRNTPVQVRGVDGVGFLSDIQAIEIGNESTIAITSDNHVLTWGRNFYGQLGNNSSVDTSFPVMVHGPFGGHLENIVAVYGGLDHDLALSNDGTVWTWGRNDDGQLGNGSFLLNRVPTQVLGLGGIGFLDNIVQIAGGAHMSLALDADGNVYSWGNGTYLGVGTSSATPYPVRVHGPGGVGYLTDIVQIACGDYHCIALCSDGNIYCWGQGSHGQLGNGSYSTCNTPQLVLSSSGSESLDDVAFIEGGRWHTVAYKNDGTVWAWGINDYFELGIGILGERNIPVQVHGFGDIGFFNIFE